MTVQAEVEAEIRRLHFAEHWPVGTISKQLAVHADVVRRVVGLFSPRRKPAPLTPRLCAPYMEFIAETLARLPALRHGARARLPGQPAHAARARGARAPPALARGLPAHRGAHRRAGPGRLGARRQRQGRGRAALALGLRAGALLVARDVGRAGLRLDRAVALPFLGARRPAAGRLPAAVALRQSQDGGAGAARRG